MEQLDSKEKKPLGRREERQQALDFVFEGLFRDDSPEEAFEDAANARDTQISEYARTVVSGIQEHQTEIDEIIEQNLKGWKKNRLARITLTILRIAVYEMLYMKDIPFSVSINEAVELAKRYATDKDAVYINGVLGTAARQLEKSGEA